MADFDDAVALMGDWWLPSPSPRTFFASVLGDGKGSKSVEEPLAGFKAEGIHQACQMPLAPQDAAKEELVQSVRQQPSEGLLSKQKSGSRGGLSQRIAARAGFTAPRLNTGNIVPADFTAKPGMKSLNLTTNPSFSPTTLLESPVFLSNAWVQPSPTTGKLPPIPRSNTTNNILRHTDVSSFSFEPALNTCSSIFDESASKMHPPMSPQKVFPGTDVVVEGDRGNSLQPQTGNASKPFSNTSDDVSYRAETVLSARKNRRGSRELANQKAELSQPFSRQQEEQPKSDFTATVGEVLPEKGYNWRQQDKKRVEGCEYRSGYYEGTSQDLQVRKEVGRPFEGHVKDISYKGARNPSKPQLDHQLGADPKPPRDQNGDDVNLGWTNTQELIISKRTRDTSDGTTLASTVSEYNRQSASLETQNGTQFNKLGDGSDPSSVISNDEDDGGTHDSASLGCEGEGDESESKRRKLEAYATEMSGATRAIREPRIVVQTTSDVDILDDGYRWRKYGQKVVKGNPNPRSYYKCTSPGCTVRKHVERASHDLKSVITTYEGKHNHDVPVARSTSSGQANSSAGSAGGTAQSGASLQNHQLPQSESSRSQNTALRFSPAGLGSFSPLTLPRTQIGLSRLAFGMNYPGLSRFSPGQLKLPGLLPLPHYAQQQLPTSEASSVMAPRTKSEGSQQVMNIANGSTVYHQIMNRLALGSQM